MRGRRGRLRLLGLGLVVYGIIGIILFVIVAVAVARPLELAQSVDDERAALVASLTQAETTMRDMSTSVGRLNTSLGTAKTAIDQATTISTSVAQSMYGLRDAMSIQIPILGGQPLLGLAGNFDTTGQNLDQLSIDISAIGSALNANQADVALTGVNMTNLANSVGKLATSVRDGPAISISTRTLDAVRLGVYAVTAWLVLFALGCLVAGMYLVNVSRRPSTTV
jgi:hypothetical protein